jgi:hypothetical protein
MGDPFEIVFDVLLALVLRCEFAGGGRIKLIEPDFFTRFDAKLLAVIHDSSVRCCARAPWPHCGTKMSVRSTLLPDGWVRIAR